MGSRGENLPFYGDPNSRPTEYLADGTKRVVPGAPLRYPSWGRIRTTNDRRRIAVSRPHARPAEADVARAAVPGQLHLLALDRHLVGRPAGQQRLHHRRRAAPLTGGTSSSSAAARRSTCRTTSSFNAVYELPWGRSLTGVKGRARQGLAVLRDRHRVERRCRSIPIIGFDRAGDRQSDTDMQRPSWAPGRNAENAITGNVDGWFDPDGVRPAAGGHLRRRARNSLRGPNLRVVDFSTFKNQQIGRTVLQLRLEIFNLFNRANFAPPSDRGHPVQLDRSAVDRRGTHHDARHTCAAAAARGEVAVLGP